jgi:hypothetical protein
MSLIMEKSLSARLLIGEFTFLVFFYSLLGYSDAGQHLRLILRGRRFWQILTGGN